MAFTSRSVILGLGAPRAVGERGTPVADLTAGCGKSDEEQGVADRH